MSAMEPFCHLVGINSSTLQKRENNCLEALLFWEVCEELNENFKRLNKTYFRLLNFDLEKENTMLENDFVCFLVNDILSTDQYTLEGIAQYTNVPEDVIYDVISGYNKSPSAKFLRSLIELHKSVRGEFYQSIIKKIALNYVTAA